MAYCKNHFDRSSETQSFEIVADGIVGTFEETYIVGQYVWLVGSFINDGVYKISEVTTTKLTLDATLQAENTDETMVLYGLAPDNDFLSIVADIETWVTANAGSEGIASESLGNYSVSFATGSDGATANSWQSAFSGRLERYRQVYETPGNYSRRWF